MRLLAVNIVIWALVAVAAAGALDPGSWTRGGGPVGQAEAATPLRADEDPTAGAVDWPPAARFAALTQRPLFTPGRRPPAQAVDEAADETAPPPALTLVGVMAAGDARLALARTADGEVLRLREDAEVQGWRVRRITARGMALGRGARTQAYPLGQARGDARVDTPRSAPPPGDADRSRRRFVEEFDGVEEDDE